MHFFLKKVLCNSEDVAYTLTAFEFKGGLDPDRKMVGYAIWVVGLIWFFHGCLILPPQEGEVCKASRLLYDFKVPPAVFENATAFKVGANGLVFYGCSSFI